MTGTLRSTARNPVAIALMGMLILVFLILGVGGGGRFPDAFRANRTDAVVQAGSHVVTSTDFKRIFDEQKQRLEAQNKQPISNEMLVQGGFDQQLLDEIASDQAEAEMLARSGVTPGAQLVDAQIKTLPFAFDRVTGQFSEQQFTQFLAAQGLTARQAQAELADELAQRHFTFALGAGFRAPRIYAALSAIAGLENRDVSYFILNPHVVPVPAPPSDAKLLAFMKEHAAQLTRPEMRAITLVRFSAAAIAPTVTLDPAAEQKEFAFRKDSLSSPETRTVMQIPVKTAAQGAQAAARLTQGEDPAAIAKSLGVEAISYVDKPMTAIADRKMAAAAFALKAGQISGPVQGDLGMAALKVVKVTPGVAATFEAARTKIEADLRQKAARDRAFELSQKFDDARQAGSSVADAAQKAGVTTLAVGPFTANGLDADGKPNPLLTDKIVKAAFAQNAGEDSDLQDAGQGEYFALRVDRVLPPALPALAEARPALAKAYLTQTYLAALKARADSLMAQIRKGVGIEQVAASVGAKVVRQQGMQAIKAQQYQAMGRDFLQGVFGVKPGEVFAAGATNGVYIAKLDAIRPGDVTTTAKVVEAIRGRLSQDYLSDLAGAARAASAQSVKVTTNLALARQTVGIDPDLLAKRGAKGAKKK